MNKTLADILLGYNEIGILRVSSVLYLVLVLKLEIPEENDKVCNCVVLFIVVNIVYIFLLATGVNYLFPVQAETFHSVYQGCDVVAQASKILLFFFTRIDMKFIVIANNKTFLQIIWNVHDSSNSCNEYTLPFLGTGTGKTVRKFGYYLT